MILSFYWNIIGPSSNANIEDNALYIVIGICGGLGLISVIVVIVVVYCWCRRQQQKGELLIILHMNSTLSMTAIFKTVLFRASNKLITF